MKTWPVLLPVLLAAVLGLGGCASAPVRYYTLVAPAASNGAATASYQIEVLPVGIPEALDRPGLVVRQGEAGVAVLDRERWAGPLGEEVRRALSARLAVLLGAQDVSGLARAPGQPVLRVKVEIRRLDAWLGQQVDMDADWSMGFASSPQQRTVCRSRLSQSAPAGDVEALATACQQLLNSLAQRIAHAVQSHGEENDADCT